MSVNAENWLSKYGGQRLDKNKEQLNSQNSVHIVLPVEVTRALEQIPLIQRDIADIRVRLCKVDELEHEVKSVQQDVWGPDGVNANLQHIAQQAQDSDLDINQLFQENKALKKDVELLKALVIKLDRKLTDQGKDITDLRERSMRDNILIHNFKESQGEILVVELKAAIKNELGVEVDFIRAHRNSPKPNSNGKPRTITAKLSNREMKEYILKAQKVKRDQKANLPFYITAQSPMEVVERRKKLYAISDDYKKQGVQTRVVKDKLVFPDGSIYRDKLYPPNAEDVLNIDDKEADKLDELTVETSACVSDLGNKFVAIGANTKSLNEVRRLYKKVSVNPRYAKCNHRILAYRYKGTDGKIHEGYKDDGEHGAGRRLLDYLVHNNQMDIGVAVTRWYGGQHIGPKRFSMMEDVLSQVVSKLLNEPVWYLTEIFVILFKTQTLSVYCTE